MIAAAAAALLSTVLVATPAFAQDRDNDKEKAFGIAKAGQNDCADPAGTHSCAGHSKVSDDAGEWKYLAKGTCAAMKGMTAEQSKAKAKT